jgi:LmbE family N-acetylglucosaminyl deacetylase
MPAPSPELPGRTGPLRVAVVVAHPDDEALWAGGLLLSHPEWSLRIVALCRASDPDRAPRFRACLARLGALGDLGDLDDGPAQEPLDPETTQAAILALLPQRDYDLMLTHAPDGEYSWHRRHEETSRAVRDLWRSGQLRAPDLWQFAYEDGGGAYLPRARAGAPRQLPLPDEVWDRKYALLTEVYGFSPFSWEARATPRVEAFHCYTDQEWKNG